jgi:hypothetical protein
MVYDTMATKSEPFISITAAAKAEGVSRQHLHRQIKVGLVRSHGGKVRLSEVREDRARNVDASRANRRKGPRPIDPSLMAAKLRKEQALAGLRELELRERASKLVDTRAVVHHANELINEFRDALGNWPASVAPTIASQIGADVDAFRIALEKHVRGFLAERRATFNLPAPRR